MESQLLSFLILSFSTGKNRSRKDKYIAVLITLIYPYLISTGRKTWAKILSYYYPQLFVSITITQKRDKNGVIHNFFTHKSVCWYVIEKYYQKQKYLLCENDSSKKNVDNNFERIPNYCPGSTFSIVYNDRKIIIMFKNSENERSILLKSTDMKTLRDFITFVNEEYTKYCNSKLDPNKIYVFEWKNSRYSGREGEFIMTEMIIHKTYLNVYLNSKLINGIRKDISQFKSNKTFYEKKGIPYKRGYLFYGPPGTGKTSLSYAIARENKMNMYKLDIQEILSGNGHKDDIKRIAQKIPFDSVVLIEEIDTQVYNDRIDLSITNDKKKNNNDSKKSNKCIVDRSYKIPMSKLMSLLDGYDTFHGCIIIATTNHKEYLEEALIRPGRIDMHYYFGPLKSNDIKTTIKEFTNFDINVPSSKEMTSSELINQVLLPNRNDKCSIEKLIVN